MTTLASLKSIAPQIDDGLFVRIWPKRRLEVIRSELENFEGDLRVRLVALIKALASRLQPFRF